MQDLLPIPSCFSSSSSIISDDPAATKLGHSAAVLSSYRTLISGHPHIITVTWCKNLLALGLYLSIDPDNPSGRNDDFTDRVSSCCKVEMRPWHLWRRHGTKRFDGGALIDVFWDLKTAKFSDDDPEPASGYYVAVVFAAEVVLLLGDHKHDAFRRSNARPAIHDPRLLSKKEHVFAKKRFCTKARLDGQKKPREIVVEITNNAAVCSIDHHQVSNHSSSDCEMVIKIDGEVGVRVKHLQWKFRGHESVTVSESGVRVDVYWDVHDWMFGTSGLRHALFIFKPTLTSSLSPSLSSFSSTQLSCCSSSVEEEGGGGSEFCLFLYAWKVE